MKTITKFIYPAFVALALAVGALTLKAAPGDLYVADENVGSIYKFTPDGTRSTFASGLGSITGLAFDTAANLYVASQTAGSILRFTLNGTQSTFASGITPNGLAFDSAGNLYTGNFTAGTILKFTPNGTQSTFVSDLTNGTTGLAFDSAGNLFAGDYTGGNILKFTPNGTQSIFASGAGNVAGLAFDSAGNLFAGDYTGGNIFKFTPDGTQSTFASGLGSGTTGGVFDSAGNFYTGIDSDGTILKFTPGGIQSIFGSGLNNPQGLAFEPEHCTPDTWENKAPMLESVSEACAAVAGGKLYVFDWSNQAYDLVTNSWSSKMSDPVYRRGLGATGTIDGKIYVAEGWANHDSNEATRALSIYDPATDSWTDGADSLVARGNSASAVIGSKLYIAGGRACYCAPLFDTLEIYDSSTNTWSAGTSIPLPVEGAAGVALNCKFYVVGGTYQPGNTTLGAVQIYDPVTDTWTNGSSMSMPRGGMAAGVVDGKLYVVDGANNGGPVTSVEFYDPNSDTWTTPASVPPPGQYVGGGIDSKLFAIDSSGNLEAYTAVCDTCVAPPSGLVGWWPGDGNADDVVGPNNGTLQGAVTFASGEVAQAFSFDGTGYVDASDSNLPVGNSSATISAWINTTQTGEHYFVSWGSRLYGNGCGGAANEIALGIDNHLSLESCGGSVQTNTIVNDGAWHHVAGVWYGSNMATLYVDGVQQTDSTGSLPPIDIISSGHLNIGQLVQWDGGNFIGLVDELQIFNRPLSESEIQAIFNAGSAGACKPAAPCPNPKGTVQATVQTNPPGLTYAVDGRNYTATQTFSWVAGSSHTIATTSPQNGATGVRYVWASWTGGGTISHTVAPTTNKTYTASFRTQYYLTMSHGTGGTVIPVSGWKNSGTAVSISATPASGYTFSNWTGSGSGSYSGTNNPASITMNGPNTENAAFTQNNVQVTVQTNPAGRSFSVDGTPYTAAQTFSWVPGSSHTIATTSPQNGATGVRYVWSSWTGGGAISHTVAPTTNKIYTANFNTQYFLTMSHGTGGTVSPMSAWKNSGVAVSINAMPASGYHFTNWNGSGTGSFSGTTNPASITMNGPITETATFTHN